MNNESTKKVLKYGGAALKVVAGVLIIPEAPILCVVDDAVDYSYHKDTK